MIPYIGPWLSAVPPAIFALFADPPWGIVWVGLLFLFIYQVEGHIVVPNVMASALRLHPLLVIFGLLAGGELYGIAGVLVALPTMAGLRAIWELLPAARPPRALGRGRAGSAGRGGAPAAAEPEPPRARAALARFSPVWETIAAEAAAESPLWDEALLPAAERAPEPVFSPLAPPELGLGVETIYEGYLVHYGRSRLFAPPDADTALLLGDYLYAHGLVRVAETGNVDAVADLAELISLCSQARAEGRDGDGAGLGGDGRPPRRGGLERARRAAAARRLGAPSSASRGSARGTGRSSARSPRTLVSSARVALDGRRVRRAPRQDGRRGGPGHHPLDARRRADLRRVARARRSQRLAPSPPQALSVATNGQQHAPRP